MSIVRHAVPLALGASLLLSGCGAFSDDVEVDQTRITASFYPLAYAAERVAGDHFEVINLTQPGVEPHDLELSVRQTAQVADARLVVYSTGIQSAVDKAVEQNAAGDVLDAAEVITLREYGAEHDHGDEHGDEEHDHEHHEGHDHDHGEHDPHFWLDPLLMADFADAIADRLADIDPDHAADYTANAEAFRTELEQLDAAYADGLANCQRHLVVVNHDAFGYLARYGLEFESITGLSPGAEPTASEKARIQDLIRAEGLTTVFSETLASKKSAESMAADLGITTGVLDPIEGPGDANSSDDYVSLMEKNLEALKEANAC
ncbi:metal ABC transporter substrate-binding protein [Nocardioides sp. AE5]|uniref:metal ABC transporter substrate-binding protein n=1 Tax=Nocardioides sp. AE5 TaxID=2962573 RepID=UPI002881E3D2|nr:metal ABC transporter substrate-binding protein [Nocardioides sp. AE5]MDT0203294.1 metal ABC transporter substrate-binding protein [Nocardioides sp. AE5]